MITAPTEYLLTRATLPLLHARSSEGGTPSVLHIRDGRIRWAGRPGDADAPIDGRGRSDVPVIDLAGRTVLPGFIDNHVHTLITGDHATYPDLRGMGVEQIREALAAFAETNPGNDILFAYGWDYPYWPHPDKRVLDEISATRPIAAFQFSGHAACVNSAMLRQLGIRSTTVRSSDSTTIERDENGEPTGVLRERASRAVSQIRWRRMNRDPGTVDTLLRSAQESFARHGITSVGDNTWYAGWALGFIRLREQGLLKNRVSCWSRGDLRYEALNMWALRYDRGLVRRGPVKNFLDGAFSSYSALLLEPYADMPSHRGDAHLAGAALRKVLARLSLRGRQGAFHAIGDGAVRNFLDAIEAVARRHRKVLRMRHRLEHCQLVAPSDIERMAQAGVQAAVQPHAIGSPEKDERILGPERAARAYPYRALLDAGVPVSFGSDSPAESSFAPLEGIRRAVLREGPQAISVREAIDCYTKGSAFAEGTEEWKGSIAPGMAADLVILSHDPLEYDRSGDDRALRSAEVEATIMNGNVVFASENSPLAQGQRA